MVIQGGHCDGAPCFIGRKSHGAVDGCVVGAGPGRAVGGLVAKRYGACAWRGQADKELQALGLVGAGVQNIGLRHCVVVGDDDCGAAGLRQCVGAAGDQAGDDGADLLGLVIQGAYVEASSGVLRA